jgi:hypothetical protein
MGMNKWMGSGVALGVAVASTFALAATGSAQEPAELAASIEPTEISPNETVTISSDEPCLFDLDGVQTPGRLTFQVTLPSGTTDDLMGPEDLVADPEAPEADGHWSFEISFVDQDNNPVPFDPGTYTIQVNCTEDQVDPNVEPELVAPYNLLTFTVTGDPATPEEPPAAPAPAPPVVRTPDEGTG